jgi:hypothetical protein
MTGIKSLLKDYKEVATTTVTVANGDILSAKGVGNSSFKTEHGYVTFIGILHVSGLDQNFSSVPPLTSKGLTVRMLKDKCVISGKQGHVMTVKKSGSFNQLLHRQRKPQSPKIRDFLNRTCGISDSDILLSNRFVSMSTKGLFEGLPKSDQSLESIAPLCT